MAMVTQFAQPGVTFTNAFQNARDRVREERQNRQQADAYENLLGGVEDPGMRDALAAVGPQAGSAALLQNQFAQADAERRAQAARAQEGREYMGDISSRFDASIDNIAAALTGGDDDGVYAALEEALTLFDQDAQARGIDLPEGREQDAAQLLLSEAQVRARELQRTQESEQYDDYERVTLEDGSIAFVAPGQETIRTGETARQGGQTINVGAPEIPGMTDSVRAGYIRDQLQATNDAMSSAGRTLDLIAATREQMDQTGPGSVGLLGWARRTGEGALSQLGALADYGVAGQQFAEIGREAMDAANWEEGSDPSEFFNPELGGVDFLLNTLAYAWARTIDPGGRISNADIFAAKQSLGIGAFGSVNQLMSAMDRMEALSSDIYERARTGHNAYLGGEGIAPRQARTPPQAAAPDTQSQSDEVVDFTEFFRQEP